MEWYWILIIVISSCVVFFLLSILFYKQFFKRFYDFLLSFLALLLLSPLFIVLTLLGIVNMRGNPFFVQERPGKNERAFKLIKFRSMNNKKDDNGVLLPDSERLTKYGKFIRKTSLDELPELLNIVKGDMSIVGPRPLLMSYLERYNNEQKHRHDVRPGLTGYAQVNGRNLIDWDTKFEYDLFYIKSISMFLDVTIICKTIIVVFSRKGINADSGLTMEEYKGVDE